MIAMVTENIRSAVMGIKGAKLRSLLTVTGIVIGVGSVLLMVAIGDGVKSSITDQISGFGSNTLTITSGKPINTNNSGHLSGGLNLSSSFGVSTLTNTDVDTIKKAKNVLKVAPINIISGVVSHNKISYDQAFLISVTSNYAEITDLKISSGQFFSEGDDDTGKLVVVIGSNVAKDIFGSEDKGVGATLSIRGKDFKVIGIIKPSNIALSIGGGLDNVIFIPSKSADQLTGSNQVFRIVAEVDYAKNIDSVKTSLVNNIKASHGNQEDFSVLSQDDLISVVGSILDILTIFIALIASVSLLVAGVGIMNIMLVSVTERTKEIGIRKALGATKRQICWQFLIEAMILTGFGGLLGLAAAFGVGLLVRQATNINPVYSIKSIALSLLISMTIGLIFGIVPAIKAARKNPIDSLRSL